MWLDQATSDNTAKWTWSNANVEHSITSDGCLVENTGSNNRYIIPTGNGTQITVTSTDNYCFEVDLKNVDATFLRLFFLEKGFDILSSLSTTEFNTFKIENTGTTVKCYLNGTQISSQTATASSSAISIGFNNKFIFKNAKIYPI